MNELLAKKCVPCEGGVARLSLKEAKRLLTKVRGWRLVKGKALRQELVMADFPAAIEFVHDVAQEAESEGHHPDLHLTGYRNLAIDLSTRAIGGLSLNDFILAAKIDALPRKLKAMKGTKQPRRSKSASAGRERPAQTPLRKS